MIAPIVALQVALASAGVSHDLAKGQAVVTRPERPVCTDALDLQNYFRARVSGDMGLLLAPGDCAQLHARHEATVIRALPGRDFVHVKVRVCRLFVFGYMTTAALQASQ